MMPQTEIRLSPRQAQICGYLTRGASDKQIAACLGISEDTVGFHLRKLFRKFETHSRTALAVKFATLHERAAIGGPSRVATLTYDRIAS